MPWKNGGGTTLELAVEPPGATLASGFHWRISSAEVGVSGSFSLFPGLERWLLLLAGAGFGIDFGDRGQADLTEALTPLLFSGDWPAFATLLDGPCTDFNLMVDPRSHRARLEVLKLDVSRALPLRAPTTLLFVARGTVCAPALGLHLGHRHLLRIEAGTGALILAPGLAGAALIWIELSPV
jgi:hypothetical protein